MAIRFNAATDQLALASAPSSSDPITVTAWVRNQESVGNGTFIRMRAAGTIITFISSGSGVNGPTLATTGGSAGPIVGSDSFPVDEWRAIAFTISGTGSNNCTVYWSDTDGAGGNTTTATGTVATGSPTALAVGGRGGGDTTERWGGDIAHMRVWTSALSEAQIEAEWASTSAVVTSDLWAAWELPTPSDLTDSSGNGRDLTAGSTATDDTDGPLAPATTASAENATGTGTANNASAKVTPNAGNASGTGAAHDATVSTAGNTTATAESAAGTGTANNAAVSVTATTTTAAGTGTANDAAPSVTPNAGNAAGTGAANDAAAGVTPAGGNATGTGTANNAAVALTVPAGHAAGTGAANNAGPSVAPSPGAASGTGAAHDATVATSGGAVTATAEHATGTGTAYDATVSTTSSAPEVGSWGPLLALVREARTYRPTPRPVACPNDGEPLELVGGRLHCRYDGWTG